MVGIGIFCLFSYGFTAYRNSLDSAKKNLQSSPPAVVSGLKGAERMSQNGLTEKDRDSLLRWGGGECQANMKRKMGTDERMVYLRKKIGADLDKVAPPAFQAFCECASATLYAGNSLSQALSTCKPRLEGEITKQMMALGYDLDMIPQR